MKRLRCRICGFERSWFHGWSFTRGCSGKREGYEAMLHDWELLDGEDES